MAAREEREKVRELFLEGEEEDGVRGIAAAAAGFLKYDAPWFPMRGLSG